MLTPETGTHDFSFMYLALQQKLRGITTPMDTS